MTQGSADPPEHVRERIKMDVERPSDDREIPRATRDGAREPAPGEANRLADRRRRGGDQRTDAFD